MATPILVTGKTVILRDALPADVTSYLRWQTRGEWRTYDASCKVDLDD